MGRSKQSKKKPGGKEKRREPRTRLQMGRNIFCCCCRLIRYVMLYSASMLLLCQPSPPPTSRVFFHIGVFSCSNVHSRPFVANSVFVIITAHVKDYDTPGSPSITIDTRV